MFVSSASVFAQLCHGASGGACGLGAAPRCEGGENGLLLIMNRGSVTLNFLKLASMTESAASSLVSKQLAAVRKD